MNPLKQDESIHSLTRWYWLPTEETANVEYVKRDSRQSFCKLVTSQRIHALSTQLNMGHVPFPVKQTIICCPDQSAQYSRDDRGRMSYKYSNSLLHKFNPGTFLYFTYICISTIEKLCVYVLGHRFGGIPYNVITLEILLIWCGVFLLGKLHAPVTKNIYITTWNSVYQDRRDCKDCIDISIHVHCCCVAIITVALKLRYCDCIGNAQQESRCLWTCRRVKSNPSSQGVGSYG